MKRSFRPTPISAFGLAALIAAPLLAGSAGEARADGIRVRVGGDVSLRVPKIRVRVREVPRVRAHARVRVRVGGGVRIRFADPPPPPPPPPRCEYECTAVGSYQPRPAPPPARPVAEVSAPAPQPDPLRWGLGAFAGSFDVEGQEAGTDLGLLGRFRLSRRFELEAELAKTELADDARVDKRIGAALLFDLSPDGRLSPLLVAGAGFGQTELQGGELTARAGYGEVGAGLTYRITERVHVTGDLRAGKRKDADDTAFKASEPTLEEDESYLRGRLGALVYF